MRTPITTKKQFLKLWKAGELGNRLRVWDTVGELQKSDYRGNVTIRSRHKDSNFFVPSVPYRGLLSKLTQLVRRGANTRDLYFGEVPLDNSRCIQGELTGIAGSLPYYFFCSSSQQNLRTALEESGYSVHGLTTLGVLRHFMDPNSYDDILGLLEHYPDHVIELSVFDYNLGIVPNRNTIVWEVRAY